MRTSGSAGARAGGDEPTSATANPLAVVWTGSGENRDVGTTQGRVRGSPPGRSSPLLHRAIFWSTHRRSQLRHLTPWIQ